MDKRPLGATIVHGHTPAMHPEIRRNRINIDTDGDSRADIAFTFTFSEFENGVAVAWHRVPFTLGCAGNWTDQARQEHYDNLCQIDGRIVLAGEHASYIPAWQEGAILSSLDAIARLHERVVKT